MPGWGAGWRGYWVAFASAALATACGGSGDTESASDAGKDAARDAGRAIDDASVDHTSVKPRDASRDAAKATADGAKDAAANADATAAPCPPEMVQIDGFCVDRYEGYLVDVGPDGGESPHSPYDVVGDASVRAKNAVGAVPQGYISQLEATAACENAGKRLCSLDEFALACRGPDAGNYYPYGGETHEPGDCNEGKGSEMPVLFGDNAGDWTFDDFNDPRLNQLEGGLAPSGSYPKCVSPYGVFDCVGNLHEWGSDPPDENGHGRFRGGFYGDAEENGHGCLYVTSAHDVDYHDYSTGFRCCQDALAP
jgi:sulfatase modifying factor 1